MNKTISQIQSEYKQGKKVVELVEETLTRIEEKDGELNSFITVCREEALKRAKELDEGGDRDLPLFGVPISLKDMFLTKGIRTTAGSKVLTDYIPPYSATVVERLEEAGVVIVGKNNQDAWAHGASGENSDFGLTRNPHNLDYVPGGSSSGPGVAVAAGMVPVAMGTDTGGSIRLPANFLGLVGYKPTYGRVSRYGVVAMASSLDSIGHFANDVEDVARVLAVTAGSDKRDATSAGSKKYVKEGLEKEDLRGVKLGVPREYFEPIKNPEIKTNFDRVKGMVEKLGGELVEVSMPHTEEAIAVYYIIQPAEVSSNLSRYQGIRYGKGREAFGVEAERRIMIGTYTLSSGYYDAYYRTALKVRTLIVDDFNKALEKVDALLAPVSPTPPFKIGEKIDDPLEMYLQDILTVPANLAGVPGLAIPSGKTTDGLPLGVQLLARRHDEESLLPIGNALFKSLKANE